MNRWPTVIADDFTGAAEVAGTAARYGLSALVLTEPCAPVEGFVNCYDTGTRELSEDAARQRVAIFARAAASSNTWIYKKTDSILRGQVRCELEALLECTGQQRALLCPANPRRGRTIVGGQYFIDGLPLTEHPVAYDPLYPRVTNDVRALIGESPLIALPNIADVTTLHELARDLPPATLPAGGAEFFAALLESLGHSLVTLPLLKLPRPWLLVNGSRAGWANQRRGMGGAGEVSCLTLADADAARAVRLMFQAGRLMLAIGDEVAGTPDLLLSRLIDWAMAIMAETAPGTILLAGGATARALVDRCQWTRFEVQGEWESGCVALRPLACGAPLVVVKPGSYPWPALAQEHYSTVG